MIVDASAAAAAAVKIMDVGLAMVQHRNRRGATESIVIARFFDAEAENLS
jgi:hypothetical protein